MSYKLSGSKTIREDVNVEGSEIYKVFEAIFKDCTEYNSGHDIKDGNLVEEIEEYYGHNGGEYSTKIIHEATERDITLLELRNDIYNRLCK